MKMLGTIELVLLAALAFLLLSSALVSAAAGPLARRLEAWAPRARHHALLGLLVAPLFLTAWATAAALIPSLLAWSRGGVDHCAIDADHPHLCLLHHAAEPGPVAAALLVALGLWISSRLVAAYGRHRRAAALLRRLLSASSADANHGAWLLPVPEPLCLSVGLWSVEIVLSEGLVRESAPVEVEIMLRHERAHQRRRDALWALFARGTSLFLLPKTRQALLARLELAAEQACDEASALDPDERLQVAALLLKLEQRLAALTPSPLIVSIGSSSVPARVEALLEEPRRAGGSARVVVLLFALGAMLLGNYDSVHHVAERVLSVLGH